MFFIRADGNKKIGAGHMMRCLTIAVALKEALDDAWDDALQEILFVCADEDSAQLVRDYGFEAVVLGTDYRRMEEELDKWSSVMEEAAKVGSIENAQSAENSEWLEATSIIDGSNCEHTILVDSYYVSFNYLQKLRTFGKVVLVDDMQKEVYPVDVVINYNAFTSEEIYRKLYAGTINKVEVGIHAKEDAICAPKICAGSKYVPIRKQFRNQSYQVKEQVQRVLITTGGGDVDNIAGEILKVLMESNIHFDLVIGKYNPHLESFLKLQEDNPNIHIHQDVRDMAGLMKQCDLAITAGGTTIYELAAIGVPFICFSYAENQELLTEYIGEKQIAGYAGAYHTEQEATLKKIRQLFEEMIQCKEKREMCYLQERQMIDGLGAERIVRCALL